MEITAKALFRRTRMIGVGHSKLHEPIAKSELEAVKIGKAKLAGFGEACVMELLGWMDAERPPINGRTIKALRFLGFDVTD